ncbi:MAG: M48 family metallopeptidase [Candidatus Izemoplasmatales bacterium]|nr:M48 family metallopeptidase [Candidatus Izemoplasmatales bacterium]
MTFYGWLVIALFLGSALFTTGLSILNYRARNQAIPESVADIYPEAKYKKWLGYFMDNFRFGMVRHGVNTLLIVVMLLLGVFGGILTMVGSWTSDATLRILLFVGVYAFLSTLLETVFGYYHTFHIEQKHGFNKMTKKTFFLDRLKGLLLMIVLGGGLLYLLVVLYQHMGNYFYLAAFLVMVVINVISNILYVPLIVPMFNKLKPLEEGTLKEKIVAFATSAGYEVGKIKVMDASRRSTKLNAYFSGFGKMKSIVLYDTLIEKMSEDEIIAVLAHEIGHNKLGHIVKGLLQSLVVLGLYIVGMGLLLNAPAFYTPFGFSNVFFGFALILFLIMMSPLEIILGYLVNWISRTHEFEADAYSAKHVGKEPMISALKTLAKANFSNLTPHPWFVKLEYSHPTTAARIEAIQKISE